MDQRELDNIRLLIEEQKIVIHPKDSDNTIARAFVINQALEYVFYKISGYVKGEIAEEYFDTLRSIEQRNK